MALICNRCGEMFTLVWLFINVCLAVCTAVVMGWK